MGKAKVKNVNPADILYRSNQPFYNFVENSNVIMHIYSYEKKIIYANKAMLDFFGYTLDEYVRFSPWDMVHLDDREYIKALTEARLKGEERPAQSEIKVVTKNGDVIWVSIFSSVETIEGQKFVLVGGFDITDRKNTEIYLEQRVKDRTLELRRSNEILTIHKNLLMEIVSNIDDCVIFANTEGKLEFCSRKFQNILNLPEEDIINHYNNGSLTISSIDLNKKQLHFKDSETVVSFQQKEWKFLVASVPIKSQSGSLDKTLIILKPIKEVHKLVNRFSGAVAKFTFSNIIFQSNIMENTINTAKMASKSEGNVLIEGESGTGKELYAQAIHNAGVHAKGPFLAINCGAIPRELIGSELFGYAEGAFTGARKGGNPGKFELADGGTLFLDEIGDMPIDQQATLLRVLQEKQLTRIGGNKVIPINVRIICATNKNLFKEMKDGRFRQDLYYRLNVINIKIPPLRERQEDIPLLLKTFLSQMDHKWSLHFNEIDDLVWEVLKKYEWLGNVRELQNFAERLVYTEKDCCISPKSWSEFIAKSSYMAKTKPQNIRFDVDIKDQIKEMEIHQLKLLIQKHKGNITRVAQELGINRRTVYRKIEKYNLSLTKVIVE